MATGAPIPDRGPGWCQAVQSDEGRALGCWTANSSSFAKRVPVPALVHST